MLTRGVSMLTFRGQNRFVQKVNLLTCLSLLLICGLIWITTHLPLGNPKWAICSLFTGVILTLAGPLCVLFSKQSVVRTSMDTLTDDETDSQIEYPYLYSIQSTQRYLSVILTYIGLSLLLTPLIHSYSCDPRELVIGIITLAVFTLTIGYGARNSRDQFNWTHILLFGIIVSASALMSGFPIHSLLGVYLYAVVASYHTKTAVECYQLGDPDHVYCLISIPTSAFIKLIDITIAVCGDVIYRCNLLIPFILWSKNRKTTKKSQ